MPTGIGPAYNPATMQPYSVSVTDPNATLTSQEIKDIANTQIPTSSAIAPGLGQWIEQEAAASAARGNNTFSGFRLPGADMGTFMGMISSVETYLSNVGNDLRYMPTPVMMQYAVEHNLAGNPLALYGWFANATGAHAAFPGAQYGLDSQTFTQTLTDLNSAIFATTGKSDWGSAGFDPYTQTLALANKWGATQLNSMIQQNQGLNSQYGWVQYGQTYQAWQQTKAQNHAALAAQYGGNYTDQQALNSVYVNPLQAFGASGQAVTSQGGSSGSTGGSGSAASQSGQLGRAASVR